MIKVLLFGGIVIALLNSCADQSKVVYGGYSNQASTDNKGTNPKAGYSTLRYITYKMLYEETKKKMLNKLASKQETKRELNKIPKFGRAEITIYATTIDHANTNNYEYVIYENGKQIYRQKGRNEIASTPSSAGSNYWWNIDIVNIPKHITSQMTLYIIDNLTMRRDKFVITKQASLKSEK